MEKIITKSFARLMGRGSHRGFITYEELNKSLGKRGGTQQNLEKAFLHIFDNKVTLVEKKSDYKVIKKKESTISDEDKLSDKSDDPIRMYLREMGGVELLSREGEIAIAKRIEAGQEVMLNALAQSPITARKIFEWNEKLQEDKIQVREIFDIDTNYLDYDHGGESDKAITKIEKKSGLYKVITSNGSVTAKKVVFATNGFYRDDLIPKLTFCGTTPNIPVALTVLSVRVVTPTNVPCSLNIGPPLLPGWIGMLTWNSSGLFLIPLRELMTPSEYIDEISPKKSVIGNP